MFFFYRPTVLDNFSLISSQINTLNKILKNDKTPALRNLALLPLLLQQDPDPQLQVLKNVEQQLLCVMSHPHCEHGAGFSLGCLSVAALPLSKSAAMPDS